MRKCGGTVQLAMLRQHRCALANCKQRYVRIDGHQAHTDDILHLRIPGDLTAERFQARRNRFR